MARRTMHSTQKRSVAYHKYIDASEDIRVALLRRVHTRALCSLFTVWEFVLQLAAVGAS